MKGKVVALLLLFMFTTPLLGQAAATDALAGEGGEVVLPTDGESPAADEREGGKMEKVAVAAATGAAIGSIWPGPGTVLGLVAGGIYGFFFR